MPVSPTIVVRVGQVLDEDDAVQQVTTQKQRDDFLAALTAAEDWLYDQGEDEQASAFRWGPSASTSLICSRLVQSLGQASGHGIVCQGLRVQAGSAPGRTPSLHARGQRRQVQLCTCSLVSLCLALLP